MRQCSGSNRRGLCRCPRSCNSGYGLLMLMWYVWLSFEWRFRMGSCSYMRNRWYWWRMVYLNCRLFQCKLLKKLRLRGRLNIMSLDYWHRSSSRMNWLLIHRMNGLTNIVMGLLRHSIDFGCWGCINHVSLLNWFADVNRLYLLLSHLLNLPWRICLLRMLLLMLLLFHIGIYFL